MPIIIYSQISGTCSHGITCISYPWRHVAVLAIKELGTHECRGSVFRRERISSTAIRPFFPERVLHCICQNCLHCPRHGQYYGSILKRMRPFYAGQIKAIHGNHLRILQIIVDFHLVSSFARQCILHTLSLRRKPVAAHRIQCRNTHDGSRDKHFPQL